jgi:transposase
LSIWRISICGFDYRLKIARNKGLSSEKHQSILVLRNEGYYMREIAKKLKISYNPVYYSLHRTAQTVSNQNRKRSGRPRCTTEQEDISDPKLLNGSVYKCAL